MGGVIIRKLSFLLAIITIVAVFAGCTSPVESSQASPFSIYRIKDGLRLSVGDKREDIEKALDDTPLVMFEFEDETPVDKIYELVNYEYMELGYTRAGDALKLRINDNTWKIANGLKVTDSVEDVKAKYPKEHMHSYTQTKDIYISHDENGNTIEFSDKSPYILRFVIENYAVKAIVIEKNVP